MLRAPRGERSAGAAEHQQERVPLLQPVHAVQGLLGVVGVLGLQVRVHQESEVRSTEPELAHLLAQGRDAAHPQDGSHVLAGAPGIERRALALVLVGLDDLVGDQLSELLTGSQTDGLELAQGIGEYVARQARLVVQDELQAVGGVDGAGHGRLLLLNVLVRRSELRIT